MLNNDIIIELLDITNKVIKERGLEYKVNLNELEIPLSEEGVGLDSIGRISLLVEIEKRLDISFPDKYWGTKTFNSIKEIWEYITKEFYSEATQ